MNGSLANESRALATMPPRWADYPPIREMPPPSMASDGIVRATCAIYFLLFVLGLCGNSGVLTVIFCTRETRKNDKDNAIIYISALCVVDALVVMSMPLTISQILLGHWMFGSIICNIYWMMEGIGKILSTFILTLMSMDRYLAVCWPGKPQLRSLKVCVLTLVISLTVALFLLTPLPYNAMVEVFKTKASSFGGTPTRFVIKRCNTNSLGDKSFKVFIGYIFVTGYCIPVIAMTFFYSLMLLRVRSQVQEFGQSQIPLRRITLSTLGVVGFYFFCWTPYWFGILSYLIVSVPVNNQHFVYLMYAIHALPYVNSATNWIFYAVLNAQLRRNCQTSFSATPTSGKSQQRKLGGTKTSQFNGSFLTRLSGLRTRNNFGSCVTASGIELGGAYSSLVANPIPCVRSEGKIERSANQGEGIVPLLEGDTVSCI